MLNHTSRRSEENAEASFVLFRPLAIFLAIALMFAATLRQPVAAASRERSVRHSSRSQSGPAHVLMHAYAVRSARRHRAQARAAAFRTVKSRWSARHTEAEPVAFARRHRRGAVMERSARRRSRSRSVVVKDVVLRRAVEPGRRSMSAVGFTDSVAAARNASVPSPSASEIAEAAVQPRVFPEYTRTGRLIVPPPLRGSREILVHQNEMADAAGLERIENDEELDRLRDTHQLVEVAGTAALHVNPELPENRRFARPWTAQFASNIARAYYARFGRPLELNSAVRTISYQLRLQRVNGNAAAIEGETASPHLTGQAIDFGKRGMTMAEIAWMRLYLEPLMQAGMIDVEEEFQQACFHISVYRSYTGARTADLAQVGAHRGDAGDLAR